MKLCLRQGALWRRYLFQSPTVFPSFSYTGAQREHVAFIHERPFRGSSSQQSKVEAFEAARDALLQLNIMIRKGIEPDAIMYTSLIATMGRAGLEWQAYKLFSRMVEQNVRPLPETYVALRDATSKNRRALRDQIEAKIEESIDTFPQQIAQEEIARQKEEDRLCIAKFNEYLRGELPLVEGTELPLSPERREAPSPAAAATSASSAVDDKGRVEESRESEEKGTESQAKVSSPVATMRIRNPTDVWHTAQMAEELRSSGDRLAKEQSIEELAAKLDKMNEEELRIYLASQRQLRHGSKQQLIQRILSTVSERSIRAMLDRRNHYFRSVEQILANDMRALNMMGDGKTDTSSTPALRQKDNTLSEREKETITPEVLHTPWGIIRKPHRGKFELPAPRNAERLEQVALSEPELLLIRQKAEANDLDELPESLLRRYAYQFRLRWRRNLPNSLLDAVQWHCCTFFAVSEEGGKLLMRSPQPTPALRLQQEDAGMQKTLENFEAFRVISQRTNNLQVVDNKEINLHLKRIRRESLSKENKLQQNMRRERNIMAAASLATSAMEYTPPPPEDGNTFYHVKGLTGEDEDEARLELDTNDENELNDDVPLEAKDIKKQGTQADARSYDGAYSAQDMPSELPPWELFGGEEEFHLDTGRFGDPNMGRYQELSDSKFKVLPSKEAQKQWEVDEQLLPRGLQNIVEEAILEQKVRHESIEKEYQEKLQYKRYKKWDSFLQKAQNKKKSRKEEEGGVKPLPVQKRMSQLLRTGSHKQKVTEALRAKYNKDL